MKDYRAANLRAYLNRIANNTEHIAKGILGITVESSQNRWQPERPVIRSTEISDPTFGAIVSWESNLENHAQRLVKLLTDTVDVGIDVDPSYVHRWSFRLVGGRRPRVASFLWCRAIEDAVPLMRQTTTAVQLDWMDRAKNLYTKTNSGLEVVNEDIESDLERSLRLLSEIDVRSSRMKRALK